MLKIFYYRVFQFVLLVAMLCFSLFWAVKNVMPSIATPGNVQGIGVYDFLYYYIPFQVFRRGANPYDEQLLAEQLSGLSNSGEHNPIKFLYPPHVLILIAPVLSWSLPASVIIWFIINIGLLITSVSLSIRTYTYHSFLKFSEKKYLWLLLGATIFPPVFETIRWGQISILVTFGIIGIYWTLLKERPFWFGFFVLCSGIKPHLIIGLLAFLFTYLIKHKKINFITSTLAWLGSISLILMLYSPNVWSYWFDSFQIATNHAEQARNAVLVDTLQYFLLKHNGSLSHSLVWAFPASAVFICTLFALSINAISHYPRVILVSYLLAPYGWYYDQSMLILVHVISMCIMVAAMPNRKVFVIANLPVFSVLVFSVYFGESQSDYFWFPLMLFIVYEYLRNLKTPSSQISYNNLTKN